MNIALSIGMIFISLVVGYLFGSISNGVMIGKLFFKKDIRQEGSKNAGGTNAGRVFGKKIGLLVIVLDVIKTIVAIWSIFFICKYLVPEGDLFMDATYYGYISGFAACIGHTFPIFASFQGGKAVACYGGVMLAVNWGLALVGIALYLIILKLKKYVSLSSILSTLLLSCIALIPVVWSYTMDFNMIYDLYLPLYMFVLALFVLIRHKENVIRLKNGTERKITWMK